MNLGPCRGSDPYSLLVKKGIEENSRATYILLAGRKSSRGSGRIRFWASCVLTSLQVWNLTSGERERFEKNRGVFLRHSMRRTWRAKLGLHWFHRLTLFLVTETGQATLKCREGGEVGGGGLSCLVIRGDLKPPEPAGKNQKEVGTFLIQGCKHLAVKSDG